MVCCPWQPLPSVVMLPFVLLQGKEHASDIAVSVLISGFSIALCDVVLRLVAPECQRHQAWGVGGVLRFWHAANVYGWLGHSVVQWGKRWQPC
ncbi:MAG UNVERIFIED_CONTAM: hypothetical protein LVT10_24005 [Anaerolineae bacterium]